MSNAGLPRLQPDDFRQAKLNSPKVLQYFLQYVHAVCCLVDYLLDSRYRYETLVVKDCSSTQELWFNVKTFLYAKGYPKLDFFTSELHSRKLLLALGWIIQRFEVIHHLMKYHLYIASHQALPCKPDYTDSLETVLGLFRQSPHSLAWFRGQFTQEYRALQNMLCTYRRSCQRLQSYTEDRYTITELWLLKNPSQIDRYCKLVNNELTAINTIMEWETQSSLFWQWMESVYDLDCSENVQSSSKVSTKSILEEITILNTTIQEVLSRENAHIDKLQHILKMQGLKRRNFSLHPSSTTATSNEHIIPVKSQHISVVHAKQSNESLKLKLYSELTKIANTLI